jgi:hypothetical protein
MVLRYGGLLLAGVAIAAIGASAVLAGPWEDGVTAYQKGDYISAFKLWQPLAEGGDPRAENNLGVLYEKGLGITADINRAVDWYRRAATNGHLGAQDNLRDLIARGLIKQDGSPPPAASAQVYEIGPRIEELNDDIAAWRRARIVDSPASYQAYISQWPNGRFVSSAQLAKDFQDLRRLDRDSVVSAVEKVAGYVSSSELSLASLELEYAPDQCMADERFRKLNTGFGILASLYYALNSALKVDALELDYPYKGSLSGVPNETNLRHAVSLMAPADLEGVARTISGAPRLIELLRSPDVLAFLDFVIEYRDGFARQAEPALLAVLDDKIWADEGWSSWDLFYDLGFERDACLSQSLNIDNIRVRNDQTYISTALEPWAYGFWYRRTIEGSDAFVFALLKAARTFIATGALDRLDAIPAVKTPFAENGAPPVRPNPFRRQTKPP